MRHGTNGWRQARRRKQLWRHCLQGSVPSLLLLISLYMIFSNDLLVQLMIDLFLISFAFWLLRTFYFSMFYVMYSTILYTGFTLFRVCTLKEWRSVLIGLMLVDLYLFIALWSWIHEKKTFLFFPWETKIIHTHVYKCIDLGRGRVFYFFNMEQSFIYDWILVFF